MIKKIILGLVFLIIVFFCFVILGKISTKKEMDKIIQRASVDYCVNSFYVNHYIGISLSCPDNLMAQERYNGYRISPKENVNFINKKDKINVVSGNKNIFSISLMYEKFDHNNYFEPVGSDNTLKQKEIYNFFDKVEALPPPIEVRVEKVNIKEVNIGDYKFYAYSLDYSGSRIDVFILPKGNQHIKIRFNNQNEDFIKNVLLSLKVIDEQYSVNGNYKIYSNSNIKLDEVRILKDWFVVNEIDFTDINYSEGNNSINIILSNDQKITSGKFTEEFNSYIRNSKLRKNLDPIFTMDDIDLIKTCDNKLFSLEKEQNSILTCQYFEEDGGIIKFWGSIEINKNSIKKNYFHFYVKNHQKDINKNFDEELLKILNSIVTN